MNAFMCALRRLMPALVFVGGCGPSSSISTVPEVGERAATPAVDAPALVLPAGTDEAVRRITAEGLRADVEAFSSDVFEGRGPGSRGDAAARAWLIERLQGLGFEPGGHEGSWEQPFPIVGVTAQMPERWRFEPAGKTGAAKPVTLSWWDDFIAASGVQTPTVDLRDAELVFVGYGITAPEEDWDDFQGADLRGKILLVLNDDPDWDPELFGGARRLYYGRWTYKYEEAGRQGAAGAIIVHTTKSAGYPWGVVQTSWSGEQFELPAGDVLGDAHGLQRGHCIGPAEFEDRVRRGGVADDVNAEAGDVVQRDVADGGTAGAVDGDHAVGHIKAELWREPDLHERGGTEHRPGHAARPQVRLHRALGRVQRTVQLQPAAVGNEDEVADAGFACRVDQGDLASTIDIADGVTIPGRAGCGGRGDDDFGAAAGAGQRGGVAEVADGELGAGLTQQRHPAGIGRGAHEGPHGLAVGEEGSADMPADVTR